MSMKIIFVFLPGHIVFVQSISYTFYRIFRCIQLDFCICMDFSNGSLMEETMCYLVNTSFAACIFSMQQSS
jgi:hypothetical protein